MEGLAVPAIDRILELAPAKILEVGGFTYIDKDKTVTRFQPPTPATLQIATLTGLVELMEIGFEGFGNALVHVASQDEVNLVSQRSDGFGRRQVFITAKRVEPARTFKFNQYLPQEEFIIGLRSLFQQYQALDDLVAVAGNLASQAEVKQEDDGFSQRATVKAGVIRLAEKVINPRVKLTPFRTFLEAIQPSSDYIFRIHTGNGCALFDADAGNWKLEAIQNVQAWLQETGWRGSAIAAVNEIPVIA